MPLKKSAGNMYSWTTHTHSHLGGACPHECFYCYVQQMAHRFPNMKARYSGPVRLIEEELRVNYGAGKVIFIEHMNDLWAEGVDICDRIKIFRHLRQYPENVYVFQSKNPPHFSEDDIRDKDMLGTTIETNRERMGVMDPLISKAPHPLDRAAMMARWAEERPAVKRFLTIEPIMDFDLAEMVALVDRVQPHFINIGADSKGTGFEDEEPPWEKVLNLIECLKMKGHKILRKTNLARLERKK